MIGGQVFAPAHLIFFCSKTQNMSLKEWQNLAQGVVKVMIELS
jgi:hypothetical protein